MNPFRRRIVIGLILLCISSFYLFVSLARRSATNELYAALTWSFLRGKTTLPVEPRPELLSLPDPYDPDANQELRLHDASLYRGHYYLYFGAVPVVTLFLPYRVVTGMDLPNRVAVPIFCLAGYLSSCALFFLLAGHNRWLLPLWLQCAIIVSLGSMSLVCLLLRRPSFYEVAIAAGYFFVMAGFLCLARAILVRRAAGRWLFLSGLMFGLAVGCRPHLVVICGIVLGAFAVRARRSPGLVIALTTGMAACGIVLGWYNYVRFDNPMEFGRTYQLTGFSAKGSAYYGLELNLNSAFRSANEFLFLAPHVNASLPFFHTVFINPLPGRPGQPIWLEDTVGLIPVAPFALLGCLMPVFLDKRRLVARQLLDEASGWLLYAMYWSGVVVFAVLCLVGWVLGRYLVDFAPLLTFVGVAVTAVLWQTLAGRPMKSMFSWGVGAVAIYGAVANAALATEGLGSVLK